jgi:hypothetical protein
MCFWGTALVLRRGLVLERGIVAIVLLVRSNPDNGRWERVIIAQVVLCSS